MDRELLGFDDPTGWREEKPSPSLFKTILGLFLFASVASFGAFLWDSKFSKGNEKGIPVLRQSQEVEDPRWGWPPYRLEIQLYVDRGYDVRWLEGSAAQKGRKLFGEVAPFFELVVLRLWGALSFFMPLVILFLFSVSCGSVRYHDKRYAFKQISSTWYNVSVKVLFTSLPVLLLWAVTPFGIEIPFIGTIPILTEFPWLGPVWVSSPLTGSFLMGLLLCSAGFVLGSNFSREI